MNETQKRLGPLRQKRLKELIISEFVGTGSVCTRKEIGDTCLDIHLKQGGSEPGTEIGGLTGRALAELRDKNGLARWGSKDVWIFDVDPVRRFPKAVEPSLEPEPATPPEDQASPTFEDLSQAPEFRVVGRGQETVYAYYFPVYRERADWLHRPDREVKVGQTKANAQGRIKNQVQSPEGWETLLEIRCPDSRLVESSLHNALKSRGHWTPPGIRRRNHRGCGMVQGLTRGPSGDCGNCPKWTRNPTRC